MTRAYFGSNYYGTNYHASYYYGGVVVPVTAAVPLSSSGAGRIEVHRAPSGLRRFVMPSGRGVDPWVDSIVRKAVNEALREIEARKPKPAHRVAPRAPTPPTAASAAALAILLGSPGLVALRQNAEAVRIATEEALKYDQATIAAFMADFGTVFVDDEDEELALLLSLN